MTGNQPGPSEFPPDPARPQPQSGEMSAPAPNSPPSPEQLRQFQQFQEFQQFLEYKTQQPGGEISPAPGAQPAQQNWLPNQVPPGTPPMYPPPAPPTQSAPRAPMPRWAKRLLRKIIGIVLTIVLLVIAGKLTYNYFFPSPSADRPAAETGGGKYHTNDILPHLPFESVRAIYDAVAKGQAPRACGAMDDPAQQKFATDLGFPNCEAAITAMAGQVTNVNDYAESLPSSVSGEPTGQTVVVVSSCRFGVKGGPSLGSFTTTRVEMGQWLITGHENEPTPCPAPTPTTSGFQLFPGN